MAEPRVPADRGQASLETLAAIPALLLAGLIGLQLLAVGYAASLADGAVEAGAAAVAAGEPARGAVEAALPGWADGRVQLVVSDGEVELELRPPGVVPGVSGALVVRDSAWVRAGS
jgi:hypothetical protein